MNFLSEQISLEDAFAIEQLVKAIARPRMRVAELGTFTGRSALAMLPTVDTFDGHLIAVDWFRGNVGVDEAPLGRDYQANDVLTLLRQNIREAGLEDRFTLMIGSTQTVAPLIADASLDALFFDADHRYTPMRQDLDAWLPKLRPGGLAFGHDFECHVSEVDRFFLLANSETDFVNGRHYGVIRAVSERFPNVRREGRIWWSQVE